MAYTKEKETEIFSMAISKLRVILVVFFEIIACATLIATIVIWSRFNFVIYNYIINLIGWLVAIIVALAFGISSTSKNAVARITKEYVIVRNVKYSLKLYISHHVITNSKRKKTIVILFSNNKKAKIKAKAEYVNKFIEKFEILLAEKFPATNQEENKVQEISNSESLKQEQTIDVEALKKEVYQQLLKDIKLINTPAEKFEKKELVKLTLEEKMQNATRKANSYYLKNSLMDSEHEKIFYVILSKIINKDDYIIVPHVSLREVFQVIGDNFENLEYLSTHHIDFMIYENYEYKPVVAIEINGSSHNEERQQVSDTFKKAIFEKYGVQYLSIANDLVDDIDYVTNLLTDINEYSLYCKHDDRNKKMFKVDERTYKCLECKKIYTYRPLVNNL